MSQRALLLAVRDVLRAAAPNGLGLPFSQCEVEPDGRPPASCGELYFAVHAGEWAASDVEGLDESFGFQLTLTVRAGKVPEDEIGASLLYGPAGTSAEEWLRKALTFLHLDRGGDLVLQRANAYVGASFNGFVEPPRFRSGGPPQLKGPDWFGAVPAGKGRAAPAGVAQTLTFAGARRVQTIESED